jgi:hypothetical protein
VTGVETSTSIVPRSHSREIVSEVNWAPTRASTSATTLRDVELPHLRVERGLRNHDLLIVVDRVDAGEQGSRLHRLTLVEGKLDNARLHGLEADDALVRFDVAGDEEEVGAWSALDPCEHVAWDPREHDVLIAVRGERAQPQHQRPGPDHNSPHCRPESAGFDTGQAVNDCRERKRRAGWPMPHLGKEGEKDRRCSP